MLAVKLLARQCRTALAEDGAQDVWPRLVVAGAEAEADFFRDQIFHRAETFRRIRRAAPRRWA